MDYSIYSADNSIPFRYQNSHFYIGRGLLLRFLFMCLYARRRECNCTLQLLYLCY